MPEESLGLFDPQPSLGLFGGEQLSPQQMAAQPLQEARERYASEDTSLGEYIGRRAVPVVSSFLNPLIAGDLAASQRRLQEGTHTQADIERVAYEEEYNRRSEAAGHTWAGGLSDIGVRAPAFLGEAWLGGRIAGPIVAGAARIPGLGFLAPAVVESTAPLLSRAGIGAAAAGVARAVPGYAVQQAIATPAMPALYGETAVQNNLAAHRDPLDPRGLPAALGTAYIQNLILGTAGGTANRITLGGVTGFAARSAIRGPVGVAEQQAADGVAYLLGLQTNYGTVEHLVNGRPEEAARHATQQAIMFAGFGALHDGQRAARPVADAFRASVNDVGPELTLAAGRVIEEGLRTNPEMTRGQAMDLLERSTLAGTPRAYAEAIARTIPEQQVAAGPRPGEEAMPPERPQAPSAIVPAEQPAAQPPQASAPVAPPVLPAPPAATARPGSTLPLETVQAIADQLGIKTKIGRKPFTHEQLLDEIRARGAEGFLAAAEQPVAPPEAPAAAPVVAPPVSPVKPTIGGKPSEPAISARADSLLKQAEELSGRSGLNPTKARQGFESIRKAKGDAAAEQWLQTRIRNLRAELPPEPGESTNPRVQQVRDMIENGEPLTLDQGFDIIGLEPRLRTIVRLIVEDGLTYDRAAERVGLNSRQALEPYLKKIQAALDLPRSLFKNKQQVGAATSAALEAATENRKLGVVAGFTPEDMANQELKASQQRAFAGSPVEQVQRRIDNITDRLMREAEHAGEGGLRAEQTAFYDAVITRLENQIRELEGTSSRARPNAERIGRKRTSVQPDAGEGVQRDTAAHEAKGIGGRDTSNLGDQGAAAGGGEAAGNVVTPAHFVAAHREVVDATKEAVQSGELVQAAQEVIQRGEEAGIRQEQAEAAAGVPVPRPADVSAAGTAPAAADVPGGGAAESGLRSGAFAEPVSGAERRTGAVGTMGPKDLPHGETALANVFTDKERRVRNVAEIADRQRLANETVWNDALEAIRRDPSIVERTIADLEKNPRPASVQEDGILLQRRIALTNEHDRSFLAAGNAAEQAEFVRRGQYFGKEKPETLLAAEQATRAHERALNEELNRLDKVITATGTEQGRALQFRAQMAKLDYSLSGMMRSAEALKGKPLSDKEKLQITELSAKIKDLQEKLAKAEEALKGSKPGLDDPAARTWDKSKIAANAGVEEFNMIVGRFRWDNMTRTQKAMDWIRRIRIAELISSPVTAAKVGASGVTQVVAPAARNLVGEVLRRIPGIRPVAEKALIEGRGFDRQTEMTALREAATIGVKDGKDTLRTGRSDLDARYDGPRDRPYLLIDWFGGFHAAEKAPAVRAEFRRAYNAIEAAEIKAGHDVTSPAARDRIGGQAYEHSKSAKFQQDGAVVKSFNEWVTKLKASKSGLANTVGYGLDLALPIRRTPSNIVASAFEHIMGLPVATARTAIHRIGGKEPLTQAQAESIMRQFKSGTLGLPLLLLGLWTGASGGFYSGRRREDDLQPGEVNILGVRVPAWVSAHHPAIMAFHVGSAMSRARQTVHGGEHPGYIESGADAMAKLFEEVPFIREQHEISRMVQNPAQGAGQELRSLAIPALAQWLARRTDIAPGTGNFVTGTPVRRTPHGIPENLEMGIPGLRQRVPVSQR